MADKLSIEPKLSGRWRARGYGWLLEVGQGGWAIEDITAISRAPADDGAPGTFGNAFEQVPASEPDSIRLKHRGDLTTYVFDRCAPNMKLPALEAAGDNDTLRNFDVFARTFAENYAFFDLRRVNWAESCGKVRGRLNTRSDSDALRRAIADLVAPLRDAHVSIVAGDTVIDVTSPLRQRKIALQGAFAVPAWAKDRMTYTQGLQRAFGDMFLGGRFRATSNTMMIYGEVAPGIGYVTIFGEFGHADTPRSRAALDLPRPRLEAASFLADEIAAMDLALDEVAVSLASMKAIIVDARLNYGGYDRLGLALAGRFTDTPRVAYTKKAWTPAGFVNQQSIHIEPRTPSLANRPVYLLTSRQTASAGEILVLGLMACPNVTRVGEATLGILSDNLYKRLPNGWEVSLSNEIYEAPGGTLYEAVGIPPDIETPVFDPADVRGGFRHAVERAVALAKAKVSP
jgi:carboxyl-terminal processing protease